MQSFRNGHSHRRRSYLAATCPALALIFLGACQSATPEVASAPAVVTTSSSEVMSQAFETTIEIPTTRISATSSDRNLATALLMQWWDMFEAPRDADRSFLADKIFADDVVLHMQAGDLHGVDAVRAALAAIPETNGRSHHLHTLDLSPLGDDLYALEATFQYHIAHTDGTVEAGESAYHHTVRKTSEGHFVLAEINAEVLESLSDVTFIPSYEVNKARGALAYYLGTTDILIDAYPDLKNVLAEDAEIHGMFDPQKQTFNDRGDGVLIGYDEISPWLASRANAFEAVAHTIGAIEITGQDGSRFDIKAQIETQAWPKSGDEISVSLPISFVMTDTGEQFMRIARIYR